MDAVMDEGGLPDVDIVAIMQVCVSIMQMLRVVLHHCQGRRDHFFDSMNCIQRSETFLLDLGMIWLAILDENLYYIPNQLHDEYYVKIRCIQYFYYTIEHSPRRDPVRFQKSFRVYPDTFDEICSMVRVDLQTNPPSALADIPNRVVLVQRQVAICLVRLAFGMSQLNVGDLFGLSQPTVSNIIWKFVQSMIRRASHLLRWPRGEDMERIKDTFFQKCGFANCCGAIDGTHILITRPPNERSVDYFDRNKHLSVSVQAIADYSGRILDLSAGWPGSFHDTRMLLNTRFYHAAQWNQSKLSGPTRRLQNGTPVREYILGDGGYPCLPWLVVSFPRNQGVRKEQFNTKLSNGRTCVERAFGRLKGTWRILDKKMNRCTTDKICRIIYCCVLLHNLILVGREIPPGDWADGQAHPEGYAGVMERNQNVLDQENPTRAHLFAQFSSTFQDQ